MEKTRILIIDDDVHLSRLVAIMLDKTGTYASAVENRSHQALTPARRFRPELVLLDVDMPGFDGGDVARQFRADAGCAMFRSFFSRRFFLRTSRIAE
jgi:two-component system OmpR family response regulator